MKITNENLNETIKAIFAKSGLSRNELARRMGVNYNKIITLLNGTHTPRIKTVLNFLQVCECELVVKGKK